MSDTEETSIDAGEAPSADAVKAAAKVMVKLPPFWEEDPSLWFIQIEAMFQAHNITNKTAKFQTVISQLPFKALSQVADLAKTPGPHPYRTLKERLITVYSESQERRIQKLLEETHLGDLRPSQLLRRMQIQAEGAATNPVLRSVWLRALPQRVQSILAALSQDDLTQLADIADKIMEFDQANTVMEIRPSVEQEDVIKIINELKNEVMRLRKDWESSRTRARSISNNRGRSPTNKRTLCFYHDKFKKEAKKCVKPCDWKPEIQPKNSTN